MPETIKKFLLTAVVFVVCGCTFFENTQTKQTKLCMEEEKIALNDPESIELVSAQPINLDNGWFRIKVDYTSKNEQGGRVRGSVICGFVSKNSTEFNSKDFMETSRQLFIKGKKAGLFK